jgi:hypothetical protein
MSVYTRNGYDSRREYLAAVADDYGVDVETVYAIADTLGAGEDFDGLISALEDYAFAADDLNFLTGLV